MDPNLATALGWIGCVIALCSFWAVRSWVNAQSREREEYYRNEAIKKVAEMQGTASESVLALLREALRRAPPPPQSFLSPAIAREFYKGEMLKRIVDSKGADADAVVAVMREDERYAARRVREGLKVGGLVSAGAGLGLLVFLRAIIPDKPVYMAGLIPVLVGGAMLAYAFVFAPGD